MSKTLLFIRITALTVGAAAAGVGCYASYEASAKADGGYLMVAAPIVALAAAIIPAFFERAIHDRQLIRAAALFLVWLPCVATVFFTAVERVHFAKAGGEAQRSALHEVVDRAKANLSDANTFLVTATAAANKVRGLEGKACMRSCLSAKATEQAAKTRVADAEAALAVAESKAVAEASMKQPEWLLPLALEVAGMILIAAGFGLGKKPVSVAPVLTKSQIAARKGVETKKRKARLRAKARKNGPKLAVVN
jgi:hypothetical protein